MTSQRREDNFPLDAPYLLANPVRLALQVLRESEECLLPRYVLLLRRETRQAINFLRKRLHPGRERGNHRLSGGFGIDVPNSAPHPLNHPTNRICRTAGGMARQAMSHFQGRIEIHTDTLLFAFAKRPGCVTLDAFVQGCRAQRTMQVLCSHPSGEMIRHDRASLRRRAADECVRPYTNLPDLLAH